MKTTMNNNRIYYIFLLLIICSCNHAENYKDAYLVNHNGKTFIKFHGKRNLMVHDPISLFENNTYEDSDSIPISHFRKGLIKGSQLPFDDAGHEFFYNGYIIINNRYLKVNLYAIDTVNNERRIEYDAWNGEYVLKN
jgi:hypothetical protein